MKKRYLLLVPVIAIALFGLVWKSRSPAGLKGGAPSVRHRPASKLAEVRSMKQNPTRRTLSESTSFRESTSRKPRRSGRPASDEFEVRMKSLLAENTKNCYRQALRKWRNGEQSREEDRILGNLISKVRSKSLALTAGEILLNPDVILTQAQLDGYCGLLAQSSQVGAVQILCVASFRSDRHRLAALRHLATVSNPHAVDYLTQVREMSDDFALNEALALAIRHSDSKRR